MEKENNDALEQEKEDAQVIENDEALKNQEAEDGSSDKDSGEENSDKENSNKEDSDKEDSDKKDSDKKDSNSGEPEDGKPTDNGTNSKNQKESSSREEPSKKTQEEPDADKPSGSPKLLIAEIIIAVAAIGFIIFALVSNNNENGSVSGNTAPSDNTVDAPLPDDGSSAIDNSILYENIPAVPDLSELNHLTEEEAQAAAADNKMLIYTTADGADLYIGNYTNQEYFLEEVSVSETEIDDFITETVLPDFGEFVETDHTTVSANDVISANFVGKLDGVAFDNGSAENVQITVGAGGYIPGFEDGFIGMSAGETKDVPVTFPEDYNNAEMAGKDVVFTFTVNEILGTMTYPEELTDEMVQEIFYDGSCTTVAECRDLIREIMTENNVWTFITENYYITSVPEDVVYEYYREEMASQEQQAAQYGMSVEELLPLMGQTVDGLKQSAVTNAAYTAILYSICETIASENEITVSDEDIAAFATEYRYPDVETLLSMISEKAVREYLLQEKVLEYLISLVP